MSILPIGSLPLAGSSSSSTPATTLYTLADLRTQVKHRIGRRSDYDDTIVDFFLNEAYLEVANAAPHVYLEDTETFLTAEGVKAYTLPDDFDAPIGMTIIGDESNTPLRPGSIETFDETRTTTYSEPSEYAIFRNSFELFPTPDDVYSIQLRYKKKPPLLVNDADAPLLQPEWTRALLLKAEELLLHDLKDYAGEALAQGRYISYVSGLASDLAKRQQDNRYYGVRVIYE